jgi:hypothetical protein
MVALRLLFVAALLSVSAVGTVSSATCTLNASSGAGLSDEILKMENH